jgi:F0F1-type ATP synthase assembly protein I
MSLRALQVSSGLLGMIPVATGVLTMLGLADPIYADAGLPPSALLDSNLRFLGGLWLVVGLALFWLIPRMAQQTALFRVLWLMIFAGGVGRLLSMAVVGPPPWPFIGFTLLEIVGAPLFIAWQARLAKAPAQPG